MNHESLRNSIDPCPTADELASFLDGAGDCDDLCEHLEHCANCQRTLDGLAAANDPTGFARAAERSADWNGVASRLLAILSDRAMNPSVASFPVIPGYRVTGLLGRGGMGSVYDAVHLKLTRPVAIKVVTDAFWTKPELVSRFSREMVAIGQLDHPGIVRAFDAAEIDGLHFLVMEKVSGYAVSELGRRTGRLGVADSCEIVRQVALALQHAHENGLVHRDIKPSNVMVNDVGVVKLLDLGLARLAPHHVAAQDDLTATGQIVGTIDYLSPEQAADAHSIDIRSDIYSLGTMFYKLLTGTVPFAAPEYVSTIAKLVARTSTPADSVALRRDDLPDAVVAVCDQMLMTKPDQRFSEPIDVANALEPYCTAANLAALVQAASKTEDFDRRLIDPDQSTIAQTPSAEIDTQPSYAEVTIAAHGAIDAKRRSDVRRGSSETPQSAPTRGRVLGAWLVALCLVAIAGGWLGGFFHLETEHGTLVLKCIGDDFVTSLQGKKVTIRNNDTGGTHTIDLESPVTNQSIEPGSYVLLTADSGLETLTDHFKIRSGKTSEVEVWWKPKTPGDPIETVDNRTQFALFFENDEDEVLVPSLLDRSDALTIEVRIKPVLSRVEPHTEVVGFAQKLRLGTGASEELSFLTLNGDVSENIGVLKVSQRYAATGMAKSVHLAGVRDAQRKEVRLYLDGKLISKVTFDGAIQRAAGALQICGSERQWKEPSGHDNSFAGWIDELRISNSARYTDDFVPQSRLAADEQTVAVYHFDEGSGDVLTDSSGNNHHGKIIGAKWIEVDVAEPAGPPQREIATWVLQRGGQIHIGNQSVGIDDLPRGDDWTIDEIDLTSGPFDDESLKVLEPFTRLRKLSISGSKVRGEGLAYLKDIRIQFLLVHSPSALIYHHVTEIKLLEELTFVGGTVSRSQIEGLSRLGNLRLLGFNQVPLIDGQLAALQSMPQLTALLLNLNNLSDDMVTAIPDLPELETCSITLSPIGDGAVAWLMKAKKLKNLAIDGTQLSDAGLLQLAGHPNLSFLSVKGTKVTAEGYERFQQALPMDSRLKTVTGEEP